jgi:hypothetical protein
MKPETGNMKLEWTSTQTLKISAAPTIDPIRVFLQDLAPGQGRIIIECYGNAWAAYWRAMGDTEVAEFVAGVDPDYLASKLWRVGERRTKKAEGYLLRIIAVVQKALIDIPSPPAALDEVQRLRGCLERERAALAEFLIPWRRHLDKSWLDHFVKTGAVTFNALGQVFPAPLDLATTNPQ